MVQSVDFDADKDLLINISKPLFYGYMFLTGVAIAVHPGIAGTMMGISVMAAITFVSAGFSDSLEGDWGRFLEIISVITLMASLLAASYTAAIISL